MARAQKKVGAARGAPKRASVASPAAVTDAPKRILPILATLKREYPEVRCSLNYRNAFELLIATILAAQCTDARVNLVTPALFKRFPNPHAMAKADLAELGELIRSTGFYSAKAKSLLATSQLLVAEHGGKVPRTMEELVRLRGVGRKTANVVLGNAYGIPGLPVDTHVGRLSRRLGLTVSQDPVEIESELCAMLPPAEWTDFSHRLIEHGRAVCEARKPRCEECVVARLCPRIGVSES